MAIIITPNNATTNKTPNLLTDKSFKITPNNVQPNVPPKIQDAMRSFQFIANPPFLLILPRH